jgi:hypothetical protein
MERLYKFTVGQITALILVLTLFNAALAYGQSSTPAASSTALLHRTISRGGSPLTATATPFASIRSTVAPFLRKTAKRGPIAPQVAVSQGSGRTLTLLPDGHYVSIGGFEPSGYTNKVMLAAKVSDPAASQILALKQPRAWHTTTLLPDGSLLVHGGLNLTGLCVTDELLSVSGMSADLIATGLAPRAFHTATILLDGSVLFAGGTDANGEPVLTLEVWNSRTQKTRVLSSHLQFGRKGARAKLEADGRVRIMGGLMKAANGQPSADEIIDPQADQDETAPALDPQTSKPEPQVIDSRPKNGAGNLAECKLIGILFNQPLDVTTVSASTVVLTDGTNAIPARLVPSAEGEIIFVTPLVDLAPGRSYTVSLSNLRTREAIDVPLVTLQFSLSGTGGDDASSLTNSQPGKEDPILPLMYNRT